MSAISVDVCTDDQSLPGIGRFWPRFYKPSMPLLAGDSVLCPLVSGKLRDDPTEAGLAPAGYNEPFTAHLDHYTRSSQRRF